MKAYKIYLTRSREVADLLMDAYSQKMSHPNSNIKKIRSGTARDQEVIPSIFCDEGYSFCLVETEDDHPAYEIIFA